MANKKTASDLSIEVRFMLERETKGTVRYAEVNEKGDALEMANASIGTLYIRKSAFKGTAYPEKLLISVVEG